MDSQGMTSSSNLPGFTAEASLYGMNARFRTKVRIPQSDRLVYPAQGVTPWPVDVVDFGDLDLGPPRTYGTVAGSTQEDRFDACMARCSAGRGTTYSACRRTCCQQVTGFQNCVIA